MVFGLRFDGSVVDCVVFVGCDNVCVVYVELCKQIVSDDVQLLNVDFDKDIGGYVVMKQKLWEELIEFVYCCDVQKSDDDIKVFEELLF